MCGGGVWRGGCSRFTREESGEEGAYVRASNQLLLKWVPSGHWTRQTAVFCVFSVLSLSIRGKR